MKKEYKYYSDDLLKSLYDEFGTVPEIYTKNYEGSVFSIPFNRLKLLLGLKPTKTIRGCNTELWKLCEDLGNKINNNVYHSIHGKWVWFNVVGSFEGYHEEQVLALELQRQELAKEKKRLLDESILDGSYGVNNPKENGGVYLISCGDYFKIGHSSDIKRDCLLSKPVTHMR